ncbi:putative ribosome-binding factor A, mitochondrial [Eurosta solidaginis]|uniref:putative ribosome-binding factor A, mitochondrial n=1 Tax=Eurosta solidaginis TaxID=178769 RepID=UPI0035312EDC
MLRNVQRNNQHLRYIEWQAKGCANISTTCWGKGNFNAKANIMNFQGRVMNKLIGQRVSGSKKRWIPGSDNHAVNTRIQPNSDLFSKKRVASGSGKNTIRRMAVLNKLFMNHITDLLATGDASEAIVGRGLQVTRVKISPDFTCINVYWLGNGEAIADATLETELRRSSGLLRHELSQLMLMGEVPRITFVREKKFINTAEIEDILRNIDFTAIEETDAAVDICKEASGRKEPSERKNLVANMMQSEFYGKSVQKELSKLEKDEEFPEMRQDVLGLDHQLIISKLLTKMRKSQQAWEDHTNSRRVVTEVVTVNRESLEQVQEKIAEAAERFEKFLAKRRDRKNTPERKRHDRASDWVDEVESAALKGPSYAALTPTQRKLLETEDYVYENDEGNEKTKK